MEASSGYLVIFKSKSLQGNLQDLQGDLYLSTPVSASPNFPTSFPSLVSHEIRYFRSRSETGCVQTELKSTWMSHEQVTLQLELLTAHQTFCFLSALEPLSTGLSLYLENGVTNCLNPNYRSLLGLYLSIIIFPNHAMTKSSSVHVQYTS